MFTSKSILLSLSLGFIGVTQADHPPQTVAPSVYGDPHFTTWNGFKFDFHGGCDLVMLENPEFASGLGLKIHIRTTLDASNTWSFISEAVIQLGDNTLEVRGGSSGSGTYWINGQQGQEVQEEGQSSLGDFHVNLSRINDHKGRVRLDLGNGNAIAIETFKRMVRVNLGARQHPESFSGSVGVLGSYDTGDMLARDGKTIMEDPTEFGQEWQVLSSEPMLFHEVGPIQHPTKCVMPNKNLVAQASRRLGEGITEDDAALACARVSPQDRDACIFDVMATNDKDLAGSY